MSRPRRVRLDDNCELGSKTNLVTTAACLDLDVRRV